MPVSNSLADAIILLNGLLRHHKDTYVVGKGMAAMVYETIVDCNVWI